MKYLIAYKIEYSSGKESHITSAICKYAKITSKIIPEIEEDTLQNVRVWNTDAIRVILLSFSKLDN